MAIPTHILCPLPDGLLELVNVGREAFARAELIRAAKPADLAASRARVAAGEGYTELDRAVQGEQAAQRLHDLRKPLDVAGLTILPTAAR